jgi:hypothetical protein
MGSKARIPPHRTITLNTGNKSVAGSFMRPEGGQESRQITNDSMNLTVFWLFECKTGLPHSRRVSYFCKKADSSTDISATERYPSDLRVSESERKELLSHTFVTNSGYLRTHAGAGRSTMRYLPENEKTGNSAHLFGLPFLTTW